MCKFISYPKHFYGSYNCLKAHALNEAMLILLATALTMAHALRIQRLALARPTLPLLSLWILRLYVGYYVAYFFKMFG
jgi:hypothetical protein